MPWLPEFVSAVQLARRQTRAVGLADPVTQYVTALQEGATRSLEAVWPSAVVVHDPRAGKVVGHRQLKAFVQRSQHWLIERHAEFDTIASTGVDGRAVVELLIRMTMGDDVMDWPVAVVAESPDDRSVVFRTYYTQVMADGRTHERPPILDAAAPDLPPVVSAFFEALSAGDTQAAVQTFAPNGCFREPLPHGNPYRGAAELRAFFRRQFGAGGRIDLQPCAVTDDGVRCAVEYNCMRWGDRELAPQPGIAICERGLDGLLDAVRVYDDIESRVPTHPL
jgi:limonene-1,2-epoxide hydrolase